MYDFSGCLYGNFFVHKSKGKTRFDKTENLSNGCASLGRVPK